MYKHFIIILTSIFLPINKILAQADDFGVSDVDTALGGADIKQVISNIINIFLGFLGILAVVLILYGGFLLMTSKGNAEQVQKAKQLIISAIIGLVIIMSAYGIVKFVLSSLGEATGVSESGDFDYAGDDSGDPDDSDDGSGCLQPLDENEVKICSINPGSGTIGSYTTINGWNFGNIIENVIFDDGSGGTSNADLVSCNGNLIWTDTEIKIVVPDVDYGIYSVNINVGGYNDFTSFVVVEGDAGPNISCLTPDFGPSGENVMISGIGFGGTSGSVVMNGWESNEENEIIVDINSWSDNEINTTIPNNALSSDIIVNTLDGLNSSGEYFRVSCDSGDQCSSECCYNNSCYSLDVCIENDTDGIYISSIYPADGAGGTLVTLYGSGFGDIPGSVNFYDQDSGGAPASFPSSVNSNCSDYWTNNIIIVEVPGNLNTELLDVRVNIGDEESNSGNFEKNDIIRPGICGLSSIAGVFEDNIIFYGVNFNTENEVLFGGEDWVQDINYSDAQTVNTTVPNMSSQDLDLYILSDEISSNPFPFTISTIDGGVPFIINIEPDGSANSLEYITISGGNFGSQMGSVILINSNGDEFYSDIDLFPSQCSANIWKDDQIIAIFPDTGEKIKVIRSDSEESNEFPYQIQAGSANPSIACIVPDNGPENSLVDIYGISFFGDSNVIFTDGKNADLSESIINLQQILNVPVPSGATTGEVYYSNGTNSNSLLFEVGSCSSDSDCNDELCCSGDFGDYCASDCETGPNECSNSWSITTESEEFGIVQNYECTDNLQSPSPWPESLDGHSYDNDLEGAYIDSNIAVRFTRKVDIDDLLDPNNFKVLYCIEGDCSEINGNLTAIDNNKGVVFNPESNLFAAQWYEVELGIFKSDVGNDFLDLSNYNWDFKVQSNTCEITNVLVTPNSSPNKDIYLDNDKVYEASPVSDNCNICGLDYNWTWTLDNNDCSNDNCASIILEADSPNNISWIKIQGDNISEPDSISLTAESVWDSISNVTNPIILSPNLELVDYSPQCNDSCDNPIIIAEFNMNLLFPQTLSVNSCISEDDCEDVNLVIDYVNSDNFIRANTNNLSPGLYKVTVPSTVENEYEDILGYNHIWYFNVGNNNCEFDNIDISPDDYTSTEISEEILYTAIPYSNSGICNGQPLNCSDCTWNWVLDDDNIANTDNSTINQSTIITLLEGQTNIYAGISEDDVSDGQDNLTVSLSTDEDDDADDDEEEEDYDVPDSPYILSSDPAGSNICLNASISVIFTGSMNNQSIIDNMHVYLYFDNTYTEINGEFRFAKDDYDNDGDIESKAIFNPDEELNPSESYYVLVTTGAESEDGWELTLSPHPDVGEGPHNESELELGYLWNFSTGTDLCQISYVLIEPEEYVFTMPEEAYNFTAQAYDIASTLLNVDTYEWSLVDSSLFNLTNYNDQSPSLVSLNDNGETYLNVQVSDTNPDIGQGSYSARVEVYICENFWPTFDGVFNLFEDNDYGASDYNFSTHYCQNEGISGSELLPYLPDENFIIQEGGDVLKEYVFVIDPAISMINNYFEFDDIAEEKRHWWQKIFDWGAVRAHHYNIYNFMITENTFDYVSLQWQEDNAGSADNFILQRKTAESSWENVSGILGNPTGDSDIFGYTDYDVIVEASYEYRVGENGVYTDPITVTVGAEDSSFDIIGFRLMSNMNHLSAVDWFKEYAPNSGTSGQLIEVDGYEGLRVGNTIYVAATNFTNTNLYTNIYAFSYNIGARPSTINIYNQLINNLKLNTNLDIQDNSNTCFGNNTIECLSDYDCGVGDYCSSVGAKLNRDTERLGDLMHIKGYLDSYGNNDKYCSVNSIPCFNDDDCLGDTNFCQPHYPLLNSGTFVAGMTTSKWNSWDQEFSDTLRDGINTDNFYLGTDPVNEFNGCLEDSDQDTCWNEEAQEFICPINSLFYLYEQTSGISYNIGSNFEFDSVSDLGFGFMGGLQGNYGTGVVSIPNVVDLNSICTGDSYNGGGFPISLECGDGIVDPDTEECDGNPANICPSNNWEEFIVGCYPAGELDDVGNLIECTWYVAPENFDCGGYCGDNDLYELFEICEANYIADGTNCLDPITNEYYIPTCILEYSEQGACYPLCADGSAAANCNDGYWDPLNEKCDSTGEGSYGLQNWDCTNGEAHSCNDQCNVVCAGSGIPYLGECGNSLEEGPEECDYAGYSSPAPEDSLITYQYECNFQCEDIGGYCGDDSDDIWEECEWSNFITPSPGITDTDLQYACTTGFCTDIDGYCGDSLVQTSYGEQCDKASYVEPSPGASSETEQYACGASCEDTGGWCGDGGEQSQEQCDYYDYDVPTPTESSVTRQYSCVTDTCQDTGGWCGDTTWQEGYGEECEATIYVTPNPVDSDLDEQYSCHPDTCQDTGGYCGDSEEQTGYDEECDWSNYDEPTPGASSITRQYSCTQSCTDEGGYCGDGQGDNIQTEYGEACDPLNYPTPDPLPSSAANQYECNDNCAHTGGYCNDGIKQAAYGEICDQSDGVCNNCECDNNDCTIWCLADYYMQAELTCIACDTDGDGENGEHSGIDGVNCTSTTDCDDGNAAIYSNNAEQCDDDIDSDCDGDNDNGCVGIDLLIKDSGSAIDDCFNVWIDDIFRGATECGVEDSQISVSSLTIGSHTLKIQSIYDDVGTLYVGYSANVVESNRVCTGASSTCPAYPGNMTLGPAGAEMYADLEVSAP